MKKIMLASFASAIAIVSSSAAFAQTGSATPDGDIIVTATRQNTLLSKTPVAITAITGDGLRDKGIANPANLGEQVPNLSIDRTNGLQITIRGVTSTDGTEKGNPSAAFLLDGVYIARPQEADVSFLDINHIEVLKGPQGTLYGKNTTAGVINVITNKPEFGKFSGGGNLAYGNYNAINVDGFINYSTSDKAAFRLSAAYDSRDTFIKPAAGDANFNKNFRTNASVRLQGLFKLGDQGDILVRGFYSKLNGSRDGSVPFSNFFTANPGTSTSMGRIASWTPIGSTDAALTTTRPSASFSAVLPSGKSTNQYGGGYTGSSKPGVNDSTYGAEVEFNYNFGPVKATYLGSIRQYEAAENSNVLIGANLPGTFNGDYTQQSHELRLASSGDGPLKIQGGLYYFREESRIAFFIYNLAPAAFGNTYIYGFPQHTISATKGAFSQATYKVQDHIRLTAGIRYTDDNLNRYGHTVHENDLGSNVYAGGAYDLTPGAAGRSYVNDGDIRSKKVTWRAGFDADVGRGLLYGSIATGYKQGGFGDGCSTGDVGQSLVSSQGERCNYAVGDQHAIYYQPETLTDYEVGFRGTIAPGFKIDTNLFYYDYKNLQLSSIVPVNGANQTITTNAGKASVLGWEFEAQYAPVKGLNLTAGIDITDGHYNQFCPSGLNSSGACTTNSAGQLADYKGQKLDRTPSTVLYANASYVIPAGEGDVVASVGTRYSSAYSVTVFGDSSSPNTSTSASNVYWMKLWTPAQMKSQATLTYNAPNHAWSVSAYVKNIENKVSLVTGNATSLTMSDPRTFGVRLGAKF
jgi:iron complex outermembrane receptor protein